MGRDVGKTGRGKVRMCRLPRVNTVAGGEVQRVQRGPLRGPTATLPGRAQCAGCSARVLAVARAGRPRPRASSLPEQRTQRCRLRRGGHASLWGLERGARVPVGVLARSGASAQTSAPSVVLSYRKGQGHGTHGRHCETLG